MSRIDLKHSCPAGGTKGNENLTPSPGPSLDGRGESPLPSWERDRVRGNSPVKNEKGFALVLSLVVMAGMTVLAIAIFTTSTTDMYISRNEKEAKMAFYLAEAGIEEAIGRMDLSPCTGCPGAARFVGENTAEKQARRAGAATYTAEGFDSSFVNGVANIFGSYTVTIDYAYEAVDTWCNEDPSAGTGCSNSEIVLYGQDFGFTGDPPPPPTGFNPVYVVTSTGRTDSGTAATIRAYIAASTLNVLPPGDTILFTEGDIDIQQPDQVNGKIATSGGGVVGCVDTDGDPDNGIGCANISGEVPTWNPAWQAGDMNDYLGMDYRQLKADADAPSPIDHSGGNQLSINPNGEWGTVCNSTNLTINDVSDHICDNDAKLIYIDNDGAGSVGVQANTSGRGILLVTGNLDLRGDFLWEGMIYVMGTLTIRGNLTVYGTIMVEGDGAGQGDIDVDIIGGLDVFGSQDVAISVGDMIGVAKVVRWSRR